MSLTEKVSDAPCGVRRLSAADEAALKLNLPKLREAALQTLRDRAAAKVESIHIHIYAHIYAYIHTCICICIHTCICTCIHAYAYMHICICIHAHAYVHAYIYMHTCTYTHTYMHQAAAQRSRTAAKRLAGEKTGRKQDVPRISRPHSHCRWPSKV